METRRPTPWGWILGTLALVLIVGAAGYWLGAHHSGLFGRHFVIGGPSAGFGLLVLLALALIVALVVGVVVAALTRDAAPTTAMTYEEWHRRAHAAESGVDETAPPMISEPAPPAPPPPDAT